MWARTSRTAQPVKAMQAYDLSLIPATYLSKSWKEKSDSTELSSDFSMCPCGMCVCVLSHTHTHNIHVHTIRIIIINAFKENKQVGLGELHSLPTLPNISLLIRSLWTLLWCSFWFYFLWHLWQRLLFSCKVPAESWLPLPTLMSISMVTSLVAKVLQTWEPVVRHLK